jgi:hypothetical protein
MRPLSCLLFVLASACGSGLAKDPGPAPGADHQVEVRAAIARVLGEKYRLDGAPACRFAEPVPDKVARWHFDPQVPGQPNAFGYAYGWRVDFWVTPRYVGYPQQPESPRMAFFSDGRLRGIFWPGGDNAPLELDKWSPAWVDREWHPPRKGTGER